MARKRGRPPKSPSSSSKSEQHDRSEPFDPLTLDWETLDDIDFASLNPEQSKKMLLALEVMKKKLQQHDVSNSDGGQKEETPVIIPTESPRQPQQPNGMEKQPNVWESFDISKLRNAGGAIQAITEVIDNLSTDQRQSNVPTLQEA
ncbi:hypothetical protein RIF29_09865 [Crotalaria pallida]|uniref:Uncharacterized protein n=1 Tax=Crotalaria pallida TaxID=3830 RepID=A0AAN9FZS7_CROPI